MKRWLESVPAPPDRENLLIATLARSFLIAQFQNLELFVWGSQLALLVHLNARIDGETLANLKLFFYEPAAASFPDRFRNYPFEQYLAFLERNTAIAVVGDRAHALPAGRK